MKAIPTMTKYHIKNQKVDPGVEELHQLFKKAHDKQKELSVKCASDKEFFIVNYFFFKNFKDRLKVTHDALSESLGLIMKMHGIDSIKEEE